MVKLELDQVVMRRMKEDDIEVVKALIKVCTNRHEGICFVVFFPSKAFADLFLNVSPGRQ